ncbi:IPT/TIG domain-containing protein [Phytophthora infestans]|uniref:IPT/TIG domain-containing protein n=1 Tax=Phytophthora infestans TaxID=4787 RepID=A0A833SY83_PHYIN|nr:IPT/TIG domain-containing protein [Phytophthora infestans]
MAAALRLRLLEPSVGVVSGGTRIVLHGAGFRPPPHSLTVRLRVDLQDADNDNHSDTCDPLSWTTRQPISNTVDINGRFLLDTQLECVLPSFERQAARAIAARTCLAASSASVSSAPQLVPLSVEVILNGGEQRSNTLSFKLHQPLEVRRICPQSVLMVSPAVTATVTLNILKLSAPVVHKATPKGGHLEVLEDLSTLPVFVRVKQASERTGAVSEQTREGKWKLSPLGVYEVEFDAPTMGFGAVSVELSLNRVEFFRCKSDAPPEGFGYRVLRDVTLRAVEPACISVTSGQITEIKVVGDGFVDTGDLVVAMLQKELPSAGGDGVKPAKDVQVAVLNATYFGKTEVRCTVPANLPFGCTTFSVSLNGGRQFGQSRVVGLLHRDRALEGISPASSSLAGGTTVTIRHSCLRLEHVDALYQLQRLEPPRRIRVLFQPVSYSGSESGGGLAKVANAEAFSQTPGLLICKTPNFLENIKALNGMRAAGASESDGDNVPYMWRFTVAVAVGGEAFHGELPFSLYLPPVIRSLTQHHGPSTGDTSLKLRMKHKVPPRIKLLVRFSTLDFTKSKTIEGHPVATSTPDSSNDVTFTGSPSIVPRQNGDEDPEYLISCKSPQWIETLAGSTREVPHLTIVQVSYDAGVTFFPVIDTPPTAVQSNPLAKDLSYLCFLFYPPPVVRSAVPLSADILGGSYVRLQGEHLVDHGAQMSVIFESSALSRKVSAFVEKGELRCCAPPFNVGRARVFVSLNDEQYTLCDLHDQETNAPVEFIFYSSPTVTRISPLCACVRLSSELKIYGTNLIETDRIKVRVSFPASSGRRPLFKDVPGTARDGVITATTPVFPDEYANQNALVDVALNGANLSGTSVPLRYFSNYGITRVDPPLGAFEVPVTLTVFIAPAIVTDKILVRLRLGVIEAVAGEHESSKEESEVVHGPIDASSWTASSVELMAPSLSTLVESLSALTTAHLEVSFDGVRFHGVGNLRDHYRVYNVPQLTSANPLFGLSDRETRIVAHGVHMRPDDVVKLTLFLESTGADRSKGKDRRVAARTAPVPVTTVVAEINVKRQRLSFTCPSLAQLRASPDRQHAPIVAPSPGITNGVPDRRSQGGVDGGMLLSERVIMQISVIDGQPISLPFVFRYYRSPTLVAMNPRVGYVCSGSIVSFEFAERIATPTVDFRFGDSLPTSGRIRDERFVECFSPELSAGTHSVSISFNEQHYEPAVLKEHKGEPTEENELSAATFHAFPLPVFVLPPAGRDRVYAFGPTSGGTVVVIKGKGFVPDTKIYARFASQFKDAFDGQSEIIVGAKVVDDETIRCISPPSMRLGRAVLHVSYNLQQFSDSTCYFEYHAPTRYVARGTLCGPISGHTPLELAVEDVKGLPSHTQLLQCVVRFESEKSHTAVDVEAQFDAEMCVLSCTSPAWPSNELVNLRVSLSRGDGELFEDTRIKFLFYDPPEGVIKIEPAAGPIGGGTEVLAWCGSIVETGEITVSIQLSRSELERPRLTKRRSSTSVAPPLSRKSSLRCNQTLPPLLVKGEIVGESIRFIAPPVDGPCTAVLGISLNGINYTSTQSPLHFTYYVEPTLRRISPGWAALEGASDALVIEGEHIRDFGCNLLVRFSLQDEMQPEQNGIVVGAQFISNSTASASGDGALRCGFPAAPPGFYEHEISLNGQQFSQSQYVSKTFGNLSGTACTALLPFRHFSSPFCLATATGPAAGGSSVVLFLGGKLLKVLSRETKCQVQFTPIKGTEKITRLPLTTPNGGASPIKLSSNVADIMCMLGDIDHVNARVTCRAPLLRVACVSNVDILLPSGSGASSACQLFAIRPSDREKYYSYESPSITEIAPSCGPVSGGTQLVIEGAHILDTAQIFVRFRSSLNERECVLVPARYSRTFPGGSASASPLIICNTPPVEFMDKTISSGNDSAAQSTSLLPQPSPRNREGVAAGKARTQTYQMLAEQSLKAHRASAAHGNSDSGLGALRITRPSVRATPRGHSDAESGATVLVDFTLNAGEQFIAHSVRFHYYQDIEPRQVKWSPRHLPTQCLGGRQATDSRMLTVVLPKTFRLTDSPERVCFRFDGANPQVSMRRKSSVLLHETESRTELVIANPSKRQSTMRRSITYFQNSILSSDNIPTSPPVSTRSDSIGTAVSSRRQAVGAPGMKSRPVTPELSSPRPSTTGSSPCIAGKVISASEVTCVVPDFSTPGAVYIFFSPNAQQFVCLGELLFHPAMIIKDEHHHTTFRFCSNVGGSPFALQCSPSTVLRFLAPEDVTTAAKRNAQIRELALRKNSVALGEARSRMPPRSCEQKKDEVATATNSDDQTEGASHSVLEVFGQRDEADVVELDYEGQDGAACEETKEPFGGWQKRSFHSARVFLIPANAKLLKRVTVTATRVDNQSEAGKMGPDGAGCCVFDMSNWGEQVLLSAALPSSCGYASYSSVVALSTLRTNPSTTHLVLTQLPAARKQHVAVIGPSSAQLNVAIIDGSGKEITAIATSHEPEEHENCRSVLTEVDPSVIIDSACEVCYVCVRFGAIGCETLGTFDQEEANVQVLVSDSNGVQLCLCGPPVESSIWIVGQLALHDVDSPTASTLPVQAVDKLVQENSSLSSALRDTLTRFALSPKRASTVSSQTYTVPITFDFTSADSSRSISASSRARLVLSGFDTFQTSLAISLSPQVANGPTVTLECAMPSLSFSGIATLVISCGGVVFSNSVTVHCYDPRSWKVTALRPPCGQLLSLDDPKKPPEPMTLRLKGEHFVENRKITIRVSDKDRYFTAAGKVDQVHVLSLRLAAVKNLRRKEDKYLSSIVGGTTSGGSIVALVSSWSTFTFTIRIECGDQRHFASCRENSVFAAISSGSVLSWEEEFELRVAADRHAPLLLTAELSEPSLPKPLELAQAWIPLNGIQVGSSDIRRYTARFDEHFKRGNYVGSDATPGVATEVELLLQLSPLMLHPDYIVSQIPYSLLQQLSPQALDVQVSSGDGFYSTPHSFLVYNPPTVTHTTPSVLPRSAGGDVVVTGSGFVNSGRVCVRLFAFKKNRFTNSNEEQRALATINRVKRAESTNDGFFPYFSRDVAGTFISTTSLKFRMPSYLTSYNVYYSVSFDGRSFTEASSVSNVLLFSINAVTPKGGPISGNTYATLHGTNIDACLSSRSGLSSLVRVTWKRGARDLEHVMVPGEVYPHEDAVYFYSPHSKFGLYSIAVSVELALLSSGTTAVDTVPRFGRDEVSFVMYKTPTIKSVAPLSALVSGLSTTEIIVQGFEEKAVSNMRLAPKLRFKRRGQMQVSDAQLVSESRFECIVPRFNVANAVATELPLSALSSVRPIQRPRAGGAWSPRRVTSQPKLWTRAAGIFVALLGARNLRASKKNACNPFAVIYVGKMQLKSTRKDGVFSPVWNELFDFEWTSDSEFNLPSVRVVFENQLTADQSESLGHVELQFPVKDKQTQPFVLRAWLPLRRIRGKYYRKENEETAVHSQKNLKKQPQAPASSLGEVELAIAFVPPVAQTKKHKKALRSSIISVLTTQPQSRKQSQGKGGSSLYSAKKEKLLRAFRQRGAPVSLVPTELAVELALNGQDFWSVAPSTCYSVLTPIVVEVEPKFISIAGGSTLYLSGSNFVNTGCLRVAFAVLTKDDTTQTLRSDRTIVVEAKYRSSTSLVCTTPPLLNVATEASYLNVYVSLNGSDFDSIALPKQLVKLSEPASERPLTSVNVDERIEENDDAVMKEPLRKSPRKAPESDSAIALVNEQYVVDCKKVTALALDGCGSGRRSPTRFATRSRNENFLLVPQLRVYLTPKVTRVRPTDGVYTSHLTIDGTSFTNTGVATARFTSQSSDCDVRTAKLVVVSSTRMECNVPDFPRGVLVRIAVAMNGVEYVPCPGKLRVFQSPRLTELYPHWVSAHTTLELELRGVNLTAASTAAPTDNNRGQQDSASIQVSFSGARGKKVVHGKCEDGKVSCSIPREIWQTATHASRDKTTSHSPTTINAPILVDIWLSGKPTGSPLPLHVYREIPTVHLVSPMDGPVYGGFAIVVEGRGFIDTGKIVVRFQLYTDQQDSTPRTEDESPRALQGQGSPPKSSNILEKPQGNKATAKEKISTESVPSYVDMAAKFVSTERVLCPAPAFPQEGVYTVLVALNSVEFSRVSDGSWFLAWQNWQKRKRLLSHALFSQTSAAGEVASAAAASAPLDEDDIDKLRRKSSFMLPKIRSTLAASSEDSSSSFQAKTNESTSNNNFESGDTEETLMKDPRLLQWRPTSWMEAKVSGRTLLSLLEYLCGARETQQFICRRLRAAFRLQSAQSRGGTDSTETPALRFHLFVEALRMVFPDALMRELEELWQATEHRPDGTITIKQLLRRLLRNAPSDQRSKSPEPGPTHYDPRYSIVSSREAAAIILPPVAQPEYISDPTSTLFMDYDAAVQAVKPRAPRPVFRKRRFNTSWCNPVVEGAKEPTPSPRPPSITNRTRPRPHTRVSEDLASEATTGTTAAADDTTEAGDKKTSEQEKDNQVVTSKEDAVRTPQSPAQATAASSSKHARNSTPSSSPPPPVNTNTIMPRQANLSGPNPFYNDIAPLYAKFLNSTEVKRFLKQ